MAMTQAVDSSRERSSVDLLRHPIHSGHLTVGALKRNKDKPVLFLGDTTLTGGELADRVGAGGLELVAERLLNSRNGQ